LLAAAQTPGQELTFTAVPPGSGERIALDRDEDGVLNSSAVATSSSSSGSSVFFNPLLFIVWWLRRRSQT
jgi:hypothetical protein